MFREDPIVLKAFAGRGQDWVDIESVVSARAARSTEIRFSSSLSRSRQCVMRPDWWIGYGSSGRTR
jgi:hypothetical protein